MKHLINLILLLMLLPGAADAIAGKIPGLVPLPMEIHAGNGKFSIHNSTTIYIDPAKPEIRKIAELISLKLSFAGVPGLVIREITPGQKVKRSIELSLTGADPTLGREGYTLNISKHGILIRATNACGLFYATQTLFQLMPAELELKGGIRKTLKLPVVEIRDKPRFPYRGLHLDVCRHFFPLEFVKKYIDLMSTYKMNTFHWHLTDDQGWRIEIRKYPKLTQVGSNRSGTVIGKTSESDGISYGGYYSQDQIREIVQYASERFVNVIPEIEMPGHSLAALSAYPNLSCSGDTFKVLTEWGISDDIFCAGNDSTFLFLQDVLDEVMSLFPSPYIHIGGDEAEKGRWHVCPKCQLRMKAEGLKNEMELQSYFTKRMERYLNSKGRRLIGWDEILEGGLAPEATVMSWRGIEGGIDAARLDHDVIMTPGDYCYLDHYQADPASEPLAIGGYTTLKKVYSYEPIPPVLTQEQGKHILGAQGNVWTEYISTPEHLEYMAYPRAIALAEVNWSPKETRNWDDFSSRMEDQYKRLTYKGVNFSKGSFDVDITTIYDSIGHRNLVKLSDEVKGAEIYYTVDGSEPLLSSNHFKRPFAIDSSCTIKASVFKNGKRLGKNIERTIISNITSGKPVHIYKPYSIKYPACGDQAMTDGLLGTSSFNNGWQGYEGTDMDVVIDLLQACNIHKITTHFIQRINSWVLYPLDVEFSTSIDGINWQKSGTIHTDPQPSKSKEDREFSVEFTPIKARFIRVAAKNTGTLPDWHEYKGGLSWIFADEITVE
ncbi:MAG: family 20 glycosylhydrolase [Bacteroidetes bacterium]|nr:family 20 glycosylhydrolase [Bacteroidota bacterium]